MNRYSDIWRRKYGMFCILKRLSRFVVTLETNIINYSGKFSIDISIRTGVIFSFKKRQTDEKRNIFVQGVFIGTFVCILMSTNTFQSLSPEWSSNVT